MAKKNTEVAVLNNDALEALKQNFPQTSGFTRIQLPRIAFVSQDKFEGKGKAKKVVIEAGTFFEERETDEVNEHGKKVWEKTELGSMMEGVIVYHRKQLSHYDESAEEYTSSPIFDDSNEIVPLFCNKKEIARGTTKELKAKYSYVKEGKTLSNLKDNVILYVLKDGELFQLSIHGTSMYSFTTYARKLQGAVPAFLTEFSSEACENGSTEWNKMMFEAKRQITQSEYDEVMSSVTGIKDAIAQEKAFFADADATAEDVAGEGKKKGDEDDDF